MSAGAFISDRRSTAVEKSEAREDAERIISKFSDIMPSDFTKGYFRFTSKEKSNVFIFPTEEITTWLEEQIDCGLIDLEYESDIVIDWIVNPESNVTVWHYDEECDNITSYRVAVFNTEADACCYLEEENSGMGGHLSTIRAD